MSWLEKTVNTEADLGDVQNAPARSQEKSWIDRTASEIPSQPIVETQEQPQINYDVKLKTDQDDFMGRSEKRLNERRNEVSKSFDDYYSGRITGSELALHIAGKGVAGTALDVMGEGAVSAFRALPDEWEENIKEGLDWIKVGFLSTDLGQSGLKALSEGVEAYSQWKMENPRAAKNIESVVNIGVLLAPAKVRAKNVKPVTDSAGRVVTDAYGNVITQSNTLMARASERLINYGKMKKDKWLVDMVLPDETSKIGKARTASTKVTGHVFDKKEYVPTPFEQRMIEEVAKVPGIQKPGVGHTIQKNINILDDYTNRLKTDLESSIARVDLRMREIDVIRDFFQAIDDFASQAVTTQTLTKTLAQNVKNSAAKLIHKYSNNNIVRGNDLLQIRREFDKMLEREVKNIWNPDASQSIAIQLKKAARDAFTETLDSNIRAINPALPIRDKLWQQHRLLTAMDNMRGSAAKEANSAIGRLWQNVTQITKMRSDAVNVAAVLFGTTALGAVTAYGAPISVALASGVVTAGVERLLVNKTTMKALGFVLKEADRALNIASAAGNKAMVQQLRADRAAIIELLKNSEITKEEEFAGLTIPITKAEGQEQQ